MRIRFRKVSYAGLALAFVITAGCNGDSDTTVAAEPDASTTTPTTTTPTQDTTTPSTGGSASGSCGTDTTQRCVSWVASTARMDGSAVSMNEILGYVIRYGSSPNEMDNKITLTDKYKTAYTFSQLKSGTYYVVVSSYDTDNVESPASEVLKRSF